MSLAALEAELQRQLALLNYPARSWVPPDASGALDVAIVGAGMCGSTVGFGLLREGVRNIGMFDAAAQGREGPWLTYARMDILRSPKHLTGPDLGVPALTFRAWFETQFGSHAWERLHKIDRVMWAEYLGWLHRVLELPVDNGVRLVGIEPQGSLLALSFERGGARTRTLTRKLVLATGRDGSGRKRLPSAVDPALIPALAAHSADAIDFARLKGKRVAVIGAGASAWDNAATALESGAASVLQLVRRPALPQVNKYKAMSYPGFQHGHYRLPDALRWRAIRYATAAGAPPPHETVHRTRKHPGFELRLAVDIEHIGRAPDGRVRIATADGPEHADFVVLGTGFSVELDTRPELAALVDDVALWRDRFAPPVDEESDELGLFPYLGEGFEFLEKRAGAAPWLRNVHCFNHGCTLSHGPLAGDIPGLEIGARRLVRRLVEDLFAADGETHYAAVVKASEPELVTTPWHDPEAIRRLAEG